MPNKTSIAFAAIVASGSFAATQSHATGVSLNGLIVSSCGLTLGSSGVLAVDSTGQTLSSKNSGGVAAGAVLLTTAATYKVEVDTASSFATAPSGGAADTMDVSYNATGVTAAVNKLAGTSLDLGLGLTSLGIDVDARKSSGIFPAGLYRSDVVIRCVSR